MQNTIDGPETHRERTPEENTMMQTFPRDTTPKRTFFFWV